MRDVRASLRKAFQGVSEAGVRSSGLTGAASDVVSSRSPLEVSKRHNGVQLIKSRDKDVKRSLFGLHVVVEGVDFYSCPSFPGSSSGVTESLNVPYSSSQLYGSSDIMFTACGWDLDPSLLFRNITKFVGLCTRGF